MYRLNWALAALADFDEKDAAALFLLLRLFFVFAQPPNDIRFSRAGGENEESYRKRADPLLGFKRLLVLCHATRWT